MASLFPFFLQLPSENIVSLKFLLESYEGIGVLRTLDEQTGRVVILATEDTAPTVDGFLNSIAAELDLHRISKPPELEGDWLLEEEDSRVELLLK